MSLYNLLTPKSLFVWQRVRVANAFANNGNEWVDLFSKYNSGTYNNQWMILNSNLFIPNQPLQQNLLIILEQIPGDIKSKDVTSILERGSFIYTFFGDLKFRDPIFFILLDVS